MSKKLNIEALFSEKGPLATHFSNYEPRQEQISMAKQIADVQTNKSICLIEAGTGTGKSFAYLIPAIFAAVQRHEKTIISTHTIALQEQLLNKDVPILLEALGMDIKVVLVKGMKNYLCLKRLKGASDTLLLSDPTEAREINYLNGYSDESFEGCKSSLKIPVSAATWDKVCAERESCSQAGCPHYKDCYFFEARRNLEDAHILIVNHHLLLTDLTLRNKNERSQDLCILPKAEHLIIDEAHHLENTAIHTLTKRVDKVHVLSMLSRSFAENTPKESPYTAVKKKTLKEDSYNKAIFFESELQGAKRDISDTIQACFNQLSLFLYEELPTDDYQSSRMKKWMLPAPLFYKSEKLQPIIKEFDKLSSKMLNLCQALHELSDMCDEMGLKESLKGPLIELDILREKLKETAEHIIAFFSHDDDVKRIRSVEEFTSHLSSTISLLDAHLDVPRHLQDVLFSVFESTVLCSATLTVKQDFSFLRRKLGLLAKDFPTKKIEEGLYSSPFDYTKQMLFACPDDIPFPNERGYEEAIADYMTEIIEATKGGVFLLFTSYDMLNKCYRIMEKDKRLSKMTLLQQSDGSRTSLIERFREEKNAVLFGTDTFWEGVDVPGHALRCVIITKLPFKSPSDPFYQAYVMALEKEGLDSFNMYALPEACIKFKQGFGRLIRTNNDKGFVICLDKRIIKKAYGSFFIKSLPPTQYLFASKEEILKKIKAGQEKKEVKTQSQMSFV